MKTFAGIDLGTSSLKIGILDQAGKLLYRQSRRLETKVVENGISEQDPQKWVEACFGLLFELGRDEPDLAATLCRIGFSGHMLGMLPLDENAQPLHPCIMWNDCRSGKEAEQLAGADLSFESWACAQPTASFVAPKLLWLKIHHPDLFEHTRYLLSAKDYLRFAMSDVLATDPTDAAGSLLFDCRSLCWREDILERLGLNRIQLPDVRPSHSGGGYLKQSLRKKLGISQEVGLAIGAGDNASAALGCRVTEHGDTFVTLGTSGVIGQCASGFRELPQGPYFQIPYFSDGYNLVMGVVQDAGSGINRVLSEFGIADEHDYFCGNTRDRLSRDVQSELNDRLNAHMAKVATELGETGKALLDENNISNAITIIGGGAQNPYWQDQLAQALPADLNFLPEPGYAAAIGAATLAMSEHDCPLDAARSMPVQTADRPVV